MPSETIVEVGCLESHSFSGGQKFVSMYSAAIYLIVGVNTISGIGVSFQFEH